MKWIRIKDQLPTKGELVLGYDVFYGGFHLCRYDGTTTDNEEPWLQPDTGIRDCFIKFWMSLPDSPNVSDPVDQDHTEMAAIEEKADREEDS